MHLGIVPVKWLLSRSICCNWERFPIEWGMGPVRALVFKCNTKSSVRLLTALSMAPVSWLVNRYKYCKRGSWKIASDNQ